MPKALWAIPLIKRLLGFRNHLLLLQANQCQDGRCLLQPMCHKIARLLVGASRRVSFSSASVKGLSPFKQALGTRKVDAGLYHTKSSRAAVIAQ
jgi:hypothetical protein